MLIYNKIVELDINRGMGGLDYNKFRIEQYFEADGASGDVS